MSEMTFEEYSKLMFNDDTLSDKEKLRSYYEWQITECKRFLSETDYTVLKLYEQTLLGGSILEMFEKYRETLRERIKIRNKINDIEASIQNIDSVEDNECEENNYGD